jgi:hypothetical protein
MPPFSAKKLGRMVFKLLHARLCVWWVQGLLYLYVGDKQKAKGLFEVAHTIYKDQLVRH